MEGSYTGVDERGLWWSLEPVAGLDHLAFTYTVTALIDDRIVGEAELERSAISPEARYGELDAPGVGYWFEPAGDGPAKPVLVLGGSEGGAQSASMLAALLAEEGFLALALAYFGLPGLPAKLTNIPLEYFTHGLDWLAGHPRTDGSRIRVLGGSRGGEAALLIASSYPDQVGAVVSIAGAGPVWNGHDPDAAPGEVHFAWTKDGQPLRIPRVRDDETLDLDLVEHSVPQSRTSLLGAPPSPGAITL